MAVTATIDTPTVLASAGNDYQVSVVAHFVDGATDLGDTTFTITIWEASGTPGRTAAVNDLALQINARKGILSRQQTATGLMGALKTALEAKI